MGEGQREGWREGGWDGGVLYEECEGRKCIQIYNYIKTRCTCVHAYHLFALHHKQPNALLHILGNQKR